MSNGWINLHRCIQEHWIWQDAHRFKWWVDLLLRASHKDTKVLIDGVFKDCKRGQFLTSLSKLAEEWNVSRDIVRHFLNMLESDGMITRQTTQKYTQITICNYVSYQDTPTTEPQLSHNSATAKPTTEPQLNPQQSAQITNNNTGSYQDTPTTEPQLDSQQNPQLSHTINNKSITTSSNTSNSNKRGGKKSQTVFIPPTFEEVAAYCAERGKGVNAEKWFNHYLTVGWMVGKNKMKDWRAAVRKWENSDYDRKPTTQTNPNRTQYRNPQAVYSSESDI